MSEKPQIYLHIGLPDCGAARIQDLLDDKRNLLAKQGVMLPRSAGRKNHTRLYMAFSDPDHVDPLRWHRGHADPGAQDTLRQEVLSKLAGEIDQARPDKVILSATQLAWYSQPSELRRLLDALGPLSRGIKVLAFVDEQAALAARHYENQIFEGRQTSLEEELELSKTPGWFGNAMANGAGSEPATNAIAEVQSPPFWLDYQALVAFWQSIFGQDAVTLHPYDTDRLYGEMATDVLRQAFDLAEPLGRVEPDKPALPSSAETLARARTINELLGLSMQSGMRIPRQLRRRLLGHVRVGGAAISAGDLAPLAAHFKDSNADVIKQFPALKAVLKAPVATDGFKEPEFTMGFRATQYFAGFLGRLKEGDKSVRREDAQQAAQAKKTKPAKSAVRLPKLAQQNYTKLSGGRFAPHNKLGHVNEEQLAAPYSAIAPRSLPNGSSGNVVVGCMKNEGPYIVEWVAYHRAMGIDNFLIYTNGCDDGTSEILDHLQKMGIVQHRNNDNWRGKSPQQFALNQSLKERVIKNAEWIIHIDVDEFINVRTGNGTLDDFFAHVPHATNVAMTWRLFGHGGVTKFQDSPVIGQFDRCAPKYCPKPHTVWGFKTMMKNIGAYDKISCHRPNKLRDDRREDVHWVNGSGQDMKPEIKDRGWRSDLKSVGYDLIQLNHYALRSAESFLIKRQRGRALHVDRSIGLNYWIRMDWSDHRDVTIQRNLPRMNDEIATLLDDKKLARLHAGAVAWHRDKALELQDNPEFRDLYDNALQTRLDPLERVAYSLALDMES